MQRILYIDDESINLSFLKIAMKGKFEVVTFTSAKDGLKAMAGTEGFHAVLTDWKMPEMDGLSFIEEARKINNETPYYILTGYSADERIKRLLKDGILKGFFQKPLDVAELIDELKGNW